MAEFLAVLGGAAALAQLTGLAARFVRTLYRFAGVVKSVNAEVDRFANQVRSFSYIVDLARITLSRYCTEHPKSQVVAYLAAHRVLASIDSDAKYTLGHMRIIRDQIRRMPTRLAFVTSIVWSLKKPSIMELYPEMESIKTNLSILMSTTHMEALRASDQKQGNTKLQEEMRLVKRMLRSQLKAIYALHQQLNRGHRVGGIQRTNFFSPAHQDVLLDLGWSMYKGNAVPDPVPTSSFLSERLSESTASPSNAPDESNHGQDMESDSLISTRQMPSSRRPSISSVPPTTRGRLSPQPDPTPSEAGPAAPLASLTTNPIPARPTVHISASFLTTTIAGYIIPADPRHIHTTPRHVTAFLVPHLRINIISHALAARHNLDIRPSDTHDINRRNKDNVRSGDFDDGSPEGVLLDFGNGRRPERSIGRTTLYWSEKSHHPNASLMYGQHPPPLAVECEVCENPKAGLILGRPFLDERERRSRRRGEKT